MLDRRGFNPDLSFAAFDGKEIVSFTLNGIGLFNDGFHNAILDVLTAYDTGTGTLPAYRGKGLATKIFKYSIPFLQKAGIKQYLLEVLQNNEKALSIYKKHGFETVREFNFFVQKNTEVKTKTKRRLSESEEASFTVQKMEMGQILKMFDTVSGFWDFYPSWQNSHESIERAVYTFKCRGVFSGEKLLGYCVFDPASGDLTQIAVDKQHRRKGIASLLLREVIKRNKNENIKVVNTDVNCSSITGFLNAKNISLKGKQFEMLKNLG